MNKLQYLYFTVLVLTSTVYINTTLLTKMPGPFEPKGWHEWSTPPQMLRPSGPPLFLRRMVSRGCFGPGDMKFSYSRGLPSLSTAGDTSVAVAAPIITIRVHRAFGN